MKWGKHLAKLIDHLAKHLPPHVRDTRAHVVANADMIGRALAGPGPDDTPKPGRGARAVVNIASIHVPSFVENNYRNSYDTGDDVRLEQLASVAKVPKRSQIDHALEMATKIPQEAIYFAAAEINGPGIRFYGDICLVLAANLIEGGTPVVEANSYEALRPPRTLRQTHASQESGIIQAHINKEIADMTGSWQPDLADIVKIKVLARFGGTDRPLTVGQISEALLHDEVYVEILLNRSFSISEVDDARSSVGDTAVEHQVAECARLGPIPLASEFEWRNQRRAARIALEARGRPLKTVATGGRVK